MGEAKRKRSYNEAVVYAKECGISISIAIRRNKCFEEITRRYRKACKCPECGKYELIVDTTDYEMTHNEEWVWCSECDFTTDIHKKHDPLLHWYGFDEVRVMSLDRENQFTNWNKFVLESTESMEKMLFGGMSR